MRTNNKNIAEIELKATSEIATNFNPDVAEETTSYTGTTATYTASSTSSVSPTALPDRILGRGSFFHFC